MQSIFNNGEFHCSIDFNGADCIVHHELKLLIQMLIGQSTFHIFGTSFLWAQDQYLQRETGCELWHQDGLTMLEDVEDVKYGNRKAFIAGCRHGCTGRAHILGNRFMMSFSLPLSLCLCDSLSEVFFCLRVHVNWQTRMAVFCLCFPCEYADQGVTTM